MTNDPLKALNKKLKDNWTQYLLAVISIAVFIAAWHLYAAYLHENDSGYQGYIPYPLDVAEALVDSFRYEDPNLGLTMFDHIAASLERILLGFVIAIVIAVPLGLLMGTFRKADAVGRPIVELIRPIPPLAWIPIFIVVLGMLWGPVAIVALGIFFPVLLNVMFGVRSVEPTLMDAAKTLGANRSQMFLKVVLPFTTPYLMTGVKVGLGIGWMCIVAAEMVGNYGGGVGYFIKDTADVGAFEYMYAGMIVIGLLGILTTGVAGLIEGRLSRWMGMK
ncbi:MAG: ABC transporter permease [Thermoplasmata archaeon]|jgi:NitT/TauT family transport system permease protein|nr:ABC transporter permease [Thermoplasmata archaeon]